VQRLWKGICWPREGLRFDVVVDSGREMDGTKGVLHSLVILSWPNRPRVPCNPRWIICQTLGDVGMSDTAVYNRAGFPSEDKGKKGPDFSCYIVHMVWLLQPELM
jgi:hypothetical protein